MRHNRTPRVFRDSHISKASIVIFLYMILHACLGFADPNTFSFLEEDIDAFDEMIHRFDHAQGWSDDPIDHEGPIEMVEELRQGEGSTHDAVWALSPIWIKMGDQRGVVKHQTGIAHSPVVWAVKRSKARRWGWIKNPPTREQIFQKVSSGELKGLMMASASHCTSGALEYLSMLQVASGSRRPLTMRNLRDRRVQAKVRGWLKGIKRSDQSSLWITDDLIQKYDHHDVMVNYQAEVIRANRALTAMGREPLVQIIPRGGVMVARSTLGFIAHQQSSEHRRKERFFLKLRDHLRSPEARENLRALGWQTGGSQLDASIFRAEWNMQSAPRYLSLPKTRVIEEALRTYQDKLRQPSLTIFVLDVSGSMRGSRLKNLKEAMHQVLDPTLTKRYLIEPTPDDITIVITFSNGIRHHWMVRGNNPRDLVRLDRQVSSERARGSTHLFSALLEAYQELHEHPEFVQGHQPAIILLSDGKPMGDKLTWRGLQREIKRYRSEIKVPIHPVLFGESDDRLMRQIAEATEGHLIDAHDGRLARAFRLLQGGH